LVRFKFGTDGKGILYPETLVSTTHITNKNIGRLKPKQNNGKYMDTKENTRKIKTSENATQNPTTSGGSGDYVYLLIP
jgi:hypothetical protein